MNRSSDIMATYLQSVRACIGIFRAAGLSAKSKAARSRAEEVWDTLLEEENRVYCVIHLGIKLSQSANNWDLRAVRRAIRLER
jgi:hypothetical protein